MTALFARIIALLFLIALSPVLLVLWIACVFSDGFPVLFRQDRAGRKGVPFGLIKFRTMRDTRDEKGKLLADQQHVTGLGKFLRRSRMDELPGLINIVRGDLAWVGPRPLLPWTIQELGDRGRKRCSVKPGLTGWSQVNGNTLLTLDQKVALDLWYIENRNMLLDLRILALTVLMVIGGEKIRANSAQDRRSL